MMDKPISFLNEESGIDGFIRGLDALIFSNVKLLDSFNRNTSFHIGGGRLAGCSGGDRKF